MDEKMTFSNRPNAAQLPSDPELAVAAVLAFARGDSDCVPTAEVDALRRRVEALRDPCSTAAVDELRQHLPLLQVLFLQSTARSVQAKNPDAGLKHLRAAMLAQQAFARTLMLIRAMEGQSKSKVTLIDDGDD